ncbi:hypothetical protein SAMN00808754_1509 [Thermanaeromonas toyohensis ToBE]|uniref:CARDB protein n=1 Tax=Thermanaeromonas toyohensis ToBE TaxID=698762 RepID=A0A1W1VSZ4_9FIRM|nr:hypothetical protein [Thermanaeromonas toyohensis]SMB96505.1 hypothetical protein SAMN00808754_1509 [Thermanaeromonas toyohensis ToBE]
MRRKAFFGAFLFLSFFLLLMTVTPALAFEGGGGASQGDPRDSRAPRSEEGVTWYVRAVPVLLYNPGSLEITKGQGAWPLALKFRDVDLVWGELWTKPGWAREETRFGLNQLYIPIDPGMSPAPPSGDKEILVPAGGLEEYQEKLSQWVHIRPQVRVIEGGTVWASDASSAFYVSVPLPSREDFLAQAAGMNEALAEKWKVYLASDDPNADNGRIPSADGSNRKYYRALDAFKRGATYYYHLLLNPGPQSGNWAVAAEITPYYDEPSPDGKGFYRGKDWAQHLETSPGMVPGFIGAITPWANLKLEGPTEVVGVPGEEKEAQFTVTCEYSYPLNFNVGTMREGEQAYTKVREGLQVPAWGKVPVTLKFKIEDRPYRVRVGIFSLGVFEEDYKDNDVDVVVKPVPPDFYARIEPDRAEGEPGEEVSFTVTYGLKPEYPVPWKGLLRAFHVAGGEHPVALEPLDGAPDPGGPVEFQPGQEYRYRVRVHVQESASEVVAKVNPVDTSEDADWSDNRAVARVEPVYPCTDISVEVWADEVGVDSGGSVTVFVVVRRGYDGPSREVPVDVKLTSGAGGTKTWVLSLPKGGKASLEATYTLTGNGTVVFTGEAWPRGVEDCVPGNNRGRVSVTVEELDLPEPEDRGIFVRLIS